jgi:nitroimidazol reductase NimA-like FMN-containing flavoprotein (pyridoxamine 5'-phosphate oxidase superfamily)
MIGELSRGEIEDLLRSQQLGRIGCHASGKTYVVPVSYVYDGESIYALSAEGMKLRLMRENPQVCFEVEHVERWYHWRTVIAWGTFEELHGEEAERAYRLLHQRLTPLIEFETRLREDEPQLFESRLSDVERRLVPPGIRARQFVLYRIRLEERTGRFERL